MTFNMSQEDYYDDAHGDEITEMCFTLRVGKDLFLEKGYLKELYTRALHDVMQDVARGDYAQELENLSDSLMQGHVVRLVIEVKQLTPVDRSYLN